MRGMGLALAALLAVSLHPTGARADDAGGAQPAGQRLDLRAGRARLDFLKGPWRAERFTLSGDAWRSAGGGDLTFDELLNGLFLETTVTAEPFTYRILFSFDTAQQAYRIVSLDDQSGLADVYEGKFDDSGALVVTNVGSGTHYVFNGKPHHNRMRFAPDAEGWTWVVDASADGGATWRPQLRVVARRPAAGAAR